MSNVVTMVYDPAHTINQMYLWFGTEIDLPTSRTFDNYKIVSSQMSDFYVSPSNAMRDKYQTLKAKVDRWKRFRKGFSGSGLSITKDDKSESKFILGRNPAVILTWREATSQLIQALEAEYGVSIQLVRGKNDDPLDEPSLFDDFDS